MNDHIRRADAIKAFHEALDGGYVIQNDAQSARIINEIPAADVVPRYWHDRCMEIEIQNRIAADVRNVVLCRDCRYWGGRNGKNECSLITSLAEPRIWLKTQPDDFCSSGERREVTS